ncbi:cellulose synthase complex periplasmic endoglucanase BcsZ [Trinickia sp. LjRoot230]|uniref:cellulose synthase complex periplasmic endoglucanase BcsZ n=1 Tax=Trinickia sp. LjRoot230 TaxID=3342288 RepID=UPI003F50859E
MTCTRTTQPHAWRNALCWVRVFVFAFFTFAFSITMGTAHAASATTQAGSCEPAAWPQWAQFKHDFLSPDGRVIDSSRPDLRTVSEGQSYALFFALVANDRPAFDTILRWTENNLANGDLTAHLPAWLWGRAPNGDWRVLDSNAASDADLWIAYALLEAGALWQERSYTARGMRLAKRVLDEEAANLPGLGLALLPGPQGFHPTADAWRLNPSYAPLQVVRGLATRLDDDPRWPRLAASSAKMIEETATHGFAPDWVRFRTRGSFAPDDQTHAQGGYDAIRIYLWAGMLNPGEPAAKALLARFAPFAEFIAAHGAPPEIVDTSTGNAVGPNLGNAGFSAAAVPFLVARNETALADAQAARVASLSTQSAPGYYGSVLTLFGMGWRDSRYKFALDGTLDVAWKTSCGARRH